MTAPTDEPGFLLRMIFDKLEGVDKKLDGVVTTQAQHEVRIKTLEDKQTSRSSVWLALAVAALAWVPNIIDLLGK